MARKTQGAARPKKKRGPGRPRKKRGPGRTTPDLSFFERLQIKALVAAGHTHAEISKIIGRSRSCICREIKRGQCKQETALELETTRYEPDYAERKHRDAQSKKGPGYKIDHDHDTARALERYIIEMHYSPEAAILKMEATGEMATHLSRSTVYNYIHKQVLGIQECHLRYGFKPRRKKASDSPFEGRRDLDGRKAGESISNRPKHILNRKEFGHWEGDLVVSAVQSTHAVLTLVERKTRTLFAVKIADKKQASVIAALDFLEGKLGGLFRLMFKSVTFDNGIEFQDAGGLQRSILHDPGGAPRIGIVYYAHPYCSSERGSNENINRMLRIAFPKGTDFGTVSVEELQRHVAWINNYPRAILGGKSAIECFHEELARLIAA